jgi:hypothetical protein
VILRGLHRSAELMVYVMRTLDDRIVRLEIRTEQFRIHLASIDRNSRDAQPAGVELLSMLKKLVVLKTLRERRESAGALYAGQLPKPFRAALRP